MTISRNESGSRPVAGSLRLQLGETNSNETQSSVRSRKAVSARGRFALIGLLAIAIAAAPTAAFSAEKATETGKQGGLGAAAALSSLIYGPVKLVYATGGMIVGAFAWAFTAGDTQVAEKVFTRSVRGTYVITPEILTGDEELLFIGRDVGETSAPIESIASAQPVAAPTTENFTEEYDEMGW